MKLKMCTKRLLIFPIHKCFAMLKYAISNTDEMLHNQLLLKMPKNGIQAKGLHHEGGVGSTVDTW